MSATIAQIGKRFMQLSVIGIAGVLTFSWFIWNGYLLNVPTSNEIKRFQLPQASEIYSSDGVLLGKMYAENRKCIAFHELPDTLVNCLIATEDIRFYQHFGVDFIGLVRVGVKTLLMGEKSGGGSTITQQLVKNRYPRKDYGDKWLVIHKIREWFIAMKLESLYTKDEIITHYFNTVPFGHNQFGIYTAAQYYFNKTPKKLAIHEMATLVALLKGTSFYDPFRHPKRALERRNLVLTNLNQHNFISKEQLVNAQNADLSVIDQRSTSNDLAPYFVQHVRAKVVELIDSKKETRHINPHTAGLKIYTTLDSRVQLYAQQALVEHLEELQDSFDKEWTEEQWNTNKETLIRLIRLNRYEGFNKLIDGLENGNLTNKEKVDLVNIKSELIRLHAGFTCIKNSGDVLAWVGGRDFGYSKHDHVKGTRQVGSVFKPIVYVTAVDQGVNICNYFKNDQTAYHQYDDWQPKNASGNYEGEYTMKGALTYSLNVISVQVLLRAGLLDVLNVARQMGIKRSIPKVPSVSLGTPDISLFEMVNAYTCFPNEGRRVHTNYLKYIQHPNGKVIYSDVRSPTKTLFTKNVAAIMTNMMESVVNSGTSRALRTEYKLNTPIAGKTGTTQNQSDGWFIGYTPQFTAGAWVGAESPDIHFESLKEGAGSKTAMPIWAKFALRLKNDPECSHLLQGDFAKPNRRSLGCLNQPMYRVGEQKAADTN